MTSRNFKLSGFFEVDKKNPVFLKDNISTFLTRKNLNGITF